jgi:hypothetical protein
VPNKEGKEYNIKDQYNAFIPFNEESIIPKKSIKIERN